MSHADHDAADRGHDPNYGHAHDPAGEASARNTRRTSALIARLERDGVTSEAEITTTIERFLTAAGPHNGARLVARAWLDPAFKTLLLNDATAAIAAFGLDMTHWAPVAMRAVENTAGIHNVVVCTLCSCYPIALLGPSPGWYKSEAYRSRVVREPRSVLREFGVALDDGVMIDVWDSTAELRYLVVPQRPADTAHFNEAQLARCVSRDALIGVALAAAPHRATADVERSPMPYR